MSGDEDVPFLNFKKHYRFDFPVVVDPQDLYRHVIRVQGIACAAVFGKDGKCVLNTSGFGRDMKVYRQAIDNALKAMDGENRKKEAYVEGGTVYAPAVAEEGRIVHERMPALAAGEDGSLHLVYVSDEAGTNDVFLKSRPAGGEWGEPVPIAAGDADEYAPSIVVGKKGDVIVAYVSDEKKRYDVYSVVVRDGKPGKPAQVTRSPDDAMGPSLAFDGRSAWLAWYEWRQMGGISRDREIFVSRGSGARWSKPLQVSPKTVPAYEDHADPVVRPDGHGGAWVAWAWDYHKTLPDGPPVEENSIFAVNVSSSMKPGPVLAAGFRGEGTARDYAPTLSVGPDGVPWVAWDNTHKSSAGWTAKALFVNHLQGKDFGEQYEAEAVDGPVCSPRLLTDREGTHHLLWARCVGGAWSLAVRALGPDSPGEEKLLDVDAAAPRYPAGTFDGDGRLRVAFTDTADRHWKVKVAEVE